MSKKTPVSSQVQKKNIPPVKTNAAKKNVVSNKSNRNQYFYILGLLAIIFIVYSRSFSNQFINYDDDFYILKHPYLQNFNFSHIKPMFTEFYGSQYAPIPFIFLGFIHMIGGFEPIYYIVFGLLMHLTVTYLVFIFIRNLTDKINIALITAALFGLATVQVESVTWIAGMVKTISYSIFFVGALITYLKYTKTDQKKYLLYTLILFICSCLCKEQAVALPLALIVLDMYLKRKTFSIKVLVEKLPFFIISLIFGIITIKASGSNQELRVTQEFSFFDRIFYASYAIDNYLMRLIIPYKLSLFYPYPSLKKMGVMLYVYPAILAVVIGLFVWAIKKKKHYIMFGGLFFLVSLLFSLALQIISVREVVMADRYLYISTIGFYFIIAYAAVQLIEKKTLPSMAVYSVIGIYLLVIAFYTSNRTLVWKDTLTATTDVLNNYKSPLAFLNRGYHYKGLKQYDKALQDYTSAIQYNSKYALAYQNRGVVYFILQKDSLAIQDYSKAIEIDPNVAVVYANRGAVYARRGNSDLALKDFDKALSIDPEQKDALNNRSLVYYQIGKFKESIADLDLYLKLYPTESDFYNLRALCKTSLADYDGALNDYNLALRYKPNDGVILQNRSFMFYRQGDKKNALKDAEAAQLAGIKFDVNYINALKQ